MFRTRFFSVSVLFYGLQFFSELFSDDAFVEVAFGIEEDGDGAFPVLVHARTHDVDDLGVVGDGGDGTFCHLQGFDLQLCVSRKQCAAPPSGTKGSDRHERQEIRAQRQDGPLQGEVVGGAACGRGKVDSVAQELRHAHCAVDGDAQLGDLRRTPKERNIVEGDVAQLCSVLLRRLQHQRRDAIRGCGLQRPLQFRCSLFVEGVHEKAHAAAVDAVDFLLAHPVAPQHFQHQSVAAERENIFCALQRHGVERALDQGAATRRLFCIGSEQSDAQLGHKNRVEGNQPPVVFIVRPSAAPESRSMTKACPRVFFATLAAITFEQGSSLSGWSRNASRRSEPLSCPKQG